MIDTLSLYKTLAPHQQAQLIRYAALLAGENDRARLTGPKTAQELMADHVLDCLPLASALPEQSKTIDLGSGGGLPGFVCALLRPDCSFVLLDSIAKKTAALERMARQFALGNVQVVTARSEDYAKEHREEFDCVTARAVTALSELAELCSPLCRVGGCLLLMKGPGWRDEAAPVNGRWSELGLGEPSEAAYSLNGRERFTLTLEKVTTCPSRYPRRAGMAAKRSWTK